MTLEPQENEGTQTFSKKSPKVGGFEEATRVVLGPASLGETILYSSSDIPDFVVWISGSLAVLSLKPTDYILKTPNLCSGICAFSAMEIPRAREVRVSSGSTIPSSHSLAVE